jgi:putative transposase
VPHAVPDAEIEIVEDMQEGLLALAVGTGWQVMHAIMQEDASALSGQRVSPLGPQRGLAGHRGRVR